MAWRFGLLGVVLFAFPVLANSASWTDPYFGKSWELTPQGDEVLLLFEPGTSSLQRQSIENQESLLAVQAYNETYGTAVYHLPAATDINEFVNRVSAAPLVRGVSPVVIDHEGFTKYYVPGQLTVQFDKSLADAVCRDQIQAAGSRVLQDYWTPGYYKIEVPTGSDLFDELREWNRSASILFTEPVYMCYDDALYEPNDPFFPDQWHLSNPGTGPWLPTADVRGPEAWDVTLGDPNVLVVIIDTGLDMDHEDLFDRVIPRNGDDWDFSSSGDIPEDTGSHGTACAGIAVAMQDNGIGVTGIAPGCSLMPLKVSLSSGQNANRADAINYGVSRRPDFDGLVMSNSWRMSSGDFTAVEAAVQNSWDNDCIILFASGNGNSSTINYPARYDGAIAVGATSPCDERKNPSSCDGENWGSDYGEQQEVMAPGVLIYTTDREGSAGYTSGNYMPTFNGTSAACPLAAGVAALIWSTNSNLTNVEVRQILQESSDDQVGPPNEDSPGWDMFFGYGRVNARAAIDMAGVAESFEDDMESADDAWTTTGTGFGVDGWHLDTHRNHTEGGNFSYRCGADGTTPYSSRIDASLISPAVQLVEPSFLSFWHYIDAAEEDSETALDGGRLEITTNGGADWTVLTPVQGYTHSWGDSPGQPFDTGDPVYSGNFDWRQGYADLGSYLNETIRVRFRFGSRNLVGPGEAGEGWYIDDVFIQPMDPASAPTGENGSIATTLLQNYPNPFDGSTVIEFQLAESAVVHLTIVDAQGRRVQSRNLGERSTGTHRETVRAMASNGNALPAGIYFYQLETSEFRIVKSMTILE